MIIQGANIVSGFMLAAPKLKEFGAKEHIEKAEGSLRVYQGTIGMVELVLGILALIHRMGIVYLPFPLLGASYPQAVIAIAMGLLLSASFFEKYPPVHNFILKMRPHSIWIGIAGIAIGLGSMLFGCFVPGLCGGYGYGSNEYNVMF